MCSAVSVCKVLCAPSRALHLQSEEMVSGVSLLLLPQCREKRTGKDESMRLIGDCRIHVCDVDGDEQNERADSKDALMSVFVRVHECSRMNGMTTIFLISDRAH